MQPFGVEFTFLRVEGFLFDQHPCRWGIIDKVRNVIGNEGGITNEGDHLEISTPILRSIKGLTAFYKKIEKELIKPLKLETHFSERIGKTEYIHDTGGGHVHIGIKKSAWSTQFVRNFIDSMEKLYYLKWFFGSFSECDIKHLDENSRIGLPFGKCPSSIMILSEYNTIEHRYFDAPKNLEQTIEHVLFAQALSELLFDPDFALFSIPNWDIKRTDQTIFCFSELINDLNLDWDIYCKYVANFKEYAKYRKLK